MIRKITQGTPHSFGWMRRPDLDKKACGDVQLQVWETPAGALFGHDPKTGPLVVVKGWTRPFEE